MPWEERYWEILKEAIFVVPIEIRKRALKKIVDTAESHAKTRGAQKVEKDDLIFALKQEVPDSMKPICFNILKESKIEEL